MGTGDFPWRQAVWIVASAAAIAIGLLSYPGPSSAQFSKSNRFQPDARIPPSIDDTDIPTRTPGSTPTMPDPGLGPRQRPTPATPFDKLKLDVVICQAMAEMVGAPAPVGTCATRHFNAKRTVSILMLGCKSNRKICQFEIYGKSSELVLGNPYLQIERLLNEFQERDIVYLEDSQSQIDDVIAYLAENPGAERLRIFYVKRTQPLKSDAQLRATFDVELKAALSKPADTKGSAEKQDETEELIERWERFAEAAHNEKKWMHERLSWLLIAQPFLFAALAYIAKEGAQSPIYDIANALTCTFGLLLSVLVSIGLIAAVRMHTVWTQNLNKIAEYLNPQAPQSPGKYHGLVVPFGSRPHWPARTSPVIAPVVAVIFALIWLALLFNRSGLLIGTSVIVVAVLITVFVLALAMRGLPQLMRKSKREFARLRRQLRLFWTRNQDVVAAGGPNGSP